MFVVSCARDAAVPFVRLGVFSSSLPLAHGSPAHSHGVLTSILAREGVRDAVRHLSTLSDKEHLQAPWVAWRSWG
jgi:hypothetical protein